MSIVINGMDMPKGNSVKNLLIYSDGKVFTGHKDDINYFAEELPSAQPEDKCSECDAWNQFNRAITLLKATYSLLKKQDCSCYVLNLLSETVFYDEAECDGNCLMEDIDALLFEVERRTDD